MKVLFVIHTPKDPRTAVFNVYRWRSEFLRRQGHEAEILAPEDFPGLRGWPGRWHPLVYPPTVARWLRQRRGAFDRVIFHSYAGWAHHLTTRRGRHGFRVPTITEFHGLEPLYYHQQIAKARLAGKELSRRYRLVHGLLMRGLLRESCRRSDWVLCLNSTERAWLLAHAWVRPGQVAICSNGVEAHFFVEQRDYLRGTRLLFLGQWNELKGIRVLVTAFERLAREIPALELWCLGTLVPDTDVLEAFNADVRSRITVRPRLPHEALPAFFAEADMFVFPSLFEGASLALLEAMASALPIIATPVGAAVDHLQDDVNALLIPLNDAEALVDRIRRLTADPALRARLGRQAATTARQFEMNRVCERYLEWLNFRAST